MPNTRKLTPLENLARAARNTGYRDIKLRTEGEYVLVQAQLPSGSQDWVTVIREYIGPVEGTIDHTVTSTGIEDVFRRYLG